MLGHNWDRFLAVAAGRLVARPRERQSRARDDHLPPGDGRIDWAHIRHTLAAIEFRGWIMLELSCENGCTNLFHRALEQTRRMLGDGQPAPAPAVERPAPH